MSVDNVNGGQPAFTGRTKQGNDYDSTNAGKAVGGVLGGIAVAKGLTNAALIHKMKSDDKFVKTVCDNIDEILLADGKGAMKNSKTINTSGLYKNLSKYLKGTRIADGIIASVIVGSTLFGAGALIDKIINNHKAKQADKTVYLE